MVLSFTTRTTMYVVEIVRDVKMKFIQILIVYTPQLKKKTGPKETWTFNSRF